MIIYVINIFLRNQLHKVGSVLQPTM